MKFFAQRELYHNQRWIDTMDWKNAFQIEGYLRCGLLNTHDLLHSLQEPIEGVIRNYGPMTYELLRLFSVERRNSSGRWTALFSSWKVSKFTPFTMTAVITGIIID